MIRWVFHKSIGYERPYRCGSVSGDSYKSKVFGPVWSEKNVFVVSIRGQLVVSCECGQSVIARKQGMQNMVSALFYLISETMVQ